MNATCGALASERLDIEAAEPRHADETYAHLREPAMWRFFPNRRPTSAEALRQTYARRARGSPDPGERWENWILRERSTGAAVGDLQATILCDEAAAVIAYGVFPPYRGRGYAREAVSALLAHLQSSHGVLRAIAEISADNAPSLRLVRALGFTPVESREPLEREGYEGEELVFERRLV